MPVLARQHVELTLLRMPLPALTAAVEGRAELRSRCRRTALIFPRQNERHERQGEPGVFWSPRGSESLTAFMRSPAIEPAERIVIRLKLDALFMRSGLGTRDWIHELRTYRHGQLERIVRAMDEEGPQRWCVDGPPLPFEDLPRYRARRIIDRLDRDLLVRYVENWGAPLSATSFWQSDAPGVELVPAGHGFLAGWMRPVTTVTMDPPQWERWCRVCNALAETFALVEVESVDPDERTALLRAFDAKLVAGALVAAFHHVREVGLRYRCRPALWRRLEQAAASLDLSDEAADAAERFRAALRRV